MKRSRVLFGTLVVLAAAVLLVGCSAKAPESGQKQGGLPKSVIFATTPIGTSTYILGVGLGTVVERYTGMKAIAQPWASNTASFDGLFAGELDIFLTGQGTGYIAWLGTEDYERVGPRALREMGTGSKTGTLFVTRPDTGIKTYRDMAGKKVAYKSAVSIQATITCELALEYNGVKDKVIALNRSSMANAAEQLIEKKIDVIGGIPGDYALDIEQAAGGVVYIPIGPEETKYVQEKYPARCGVLANFPVGYFGFKQPISTYATLKGMVVRPELPEEVAYAVVKAIYDHPEDLKKMHPEVAEFTLENAIAYGFFVPMHPGAIRYYKEKGLWTKEHQERQEKLLAQEKELLAKKK